MELNFTVTNQRIKYVSNLYIVEKSRNYLTAKFSFSGSEWKNVAKTAIFKKDDNVINVLLDENGRCTVPWELITRGTLKVSVFGGDLVTVDTAEVKILKSGYEEGNAPSEPTSDVYAQILAELQSIRDDFITEEMLGQAVEDWLAENVVEALSPADVEKIVYDYLDEHKDELKGEKGAVFTPHVSDEGVMSWTNDGGLENPPPVDLKINVGGEYALLTEAGYSLALSIDRNYVMTISLKNKAGEVLDSKHIDFPIESMVVNATYKNGVVTFTLQNGNVLDVDISDLVRGLVPTSRKIAGVDLEDDITAEELKTALGYLTETDIAELNTSSAVAYYESEVNTAITAPAQTYTDMAKITLPIGTYVVQSSFRSNESGFRFYQGLRVGDDALHDTRYDSMGIVASTWSTIVHLTKETELIYKLWVDKEAIIDETQIKAVRINYNAEELDDVKSTIASVSDEVDALQANFANYLPLKGGTMTGTIYANQFHPTADSTGAIGINNQAWHIMYANKFHIYKNGFMYGKYEVDTEGTDNTNGRAVFVLGNGNASGTVGNAYGEIKIFGTSNGGTSVKTANNGTSSNTVYLPNKDGTLALQSEITALQEQITALQEQIASLTS